MNLVQGLKNAWSKFMNGKMEKEDFLIIAFLGMLISSVFKMSVSTRK